MEDTVAAVSGDMTRSSWASPGGATAAMTMDEVAPCEHCSATDVAQLRGGVSVTTTKGSREGQA